jgi:hypothetical protein
MVVFSGIIHSLERLAVDSNACEPAMKLGAVTKLRILVIKHVEFTFYVLR